MNQTKSKWIEISEKPSKTRYRRPELGTLKENKREATWRIENETKEHKKNSVKKKKSASIRFVIDQPNSTSTKSSKYLSLSLSPFFLPFLSFFLTFYLGLVAEMKITRTVPKDNDRKKNVKRKPETGRRDRRRRRPLLDCQTERVEIKKKNKKKTKKRRQRRRFRSHLRDVKETLGRSSISSDGRQRPSI